jgi:hypothetical protein
VLARQLGRIVRLDDDVTLGVALHHLCHKVHQPPTADQSLTHKLFSDICSLSAKEQSELEPTTLGTYDGYR